MECSSCPRSCGVDRILKKGFCGMGNNPYVAGAFLHKWEEPCISGINGSGTIFFSGCNLRCIYCQNFHISQENFGKEVSIEKLREILLSIQQKGAHNINLVNPTHFIPQIVDTVSGIKDLKIPLIYNTNGYESLEGLRHVEGTVQVFLPDFKYCSSEASRRYSGADNYFEIASRAIPEMYRQVGSPVFDSQGMINKGLIIRHLILPGLSGDSIKVLDWIEANLSSEVYVSLMSQYTPCHKAHLYPELNRRITRREYEKVVNHLFKRGFKNGYIQERDSATEEYIPVFNLDGIE